MTQNLEFQNSLPHSRATLESPAQHPDYRDDYREKLNRWAIARLFPDTQHTIVARFRSRSDADGHLRFLRRQIPNGNFEVVVDSPKP
jgi:hypothetical protein